MKRIPASIGILILIAVAITVGCTKDQEGVRDAAAARTPAVQKPRFETLVIPDGTNVVASLDTRLSTETNHTGDPFGATTTEPIIVGGRTVVPAGARIHGVLRDVQASGRIKGRARMTLAYQGDRRLGGQDPRDLRTTAHAAGGLRHARRRREDRGRRRPRRDHRRDRRWREGRGDRRGRRSGRRHRPHARDQG